MTAPEPTLDDELKLCNCDGFWHVECPDGITRYVDVSALITHHDAQKKAELLAGLPENLDTAFIHVSHFTHEVSCIPELERISGALAHNHALTEVRAAIEAVYGNNKEEE